MFKLKRTSTIITLLSLALLSTPVFAANDDCNSSSGLCSVVAATDQLTTTIIGQTKAVLNFLDKLIVMRTSSFDKSVLLQSRPFTLERYFQQQLNNSDLLPSLPKKMPTNFRSPDNKTNLHDRQSAYKSMLKVETTYPYIMNKTLAKTLSVNMPTVRFARLCGSSYSKKLSNGACAGNDLNPFDANSLFSSLTYSPLQRQHALNSIGYMGHLGTPYQFLSLGRYNTFKKNNGFNRGLSSPLMAKYRALVRQYTGDMSMGLSDLYYIASRHTPIYTAASSPTHKAMSADGFNAYLANYRLHNPKWIENMATAPKAALMREQELMLLEIQRDLSDRNQLDQRLLATQSIREMLIAEMFNKSVLFNMRKQIEKAAKYIKDHPNIPHFSSKSGSSGGGGALSGGLKGGGFSATPGASGGAQLRKQQQQVAAARSRAEHEKHYCENPFHAISCEHKLHHAKDEFHDKTNQANQLRHEK